MALGARPEASCARGRLRVVHAAECVELNDYTFEVGFVAQSEEVTQNGKSADNLTEEARLAGIAGLD
jgi:hypothetical protein